jgi:single-stranded-DNA-specific exonuclease
LNISDDTLSIEDLYTRLAKRFPEGYKKLGDIPAPTLLKNAKKGARRVAQAIQNKEHITLIGDYDVDGVVASSIATLFFREIGYPLTTVIPNRFKDGYGINAKILQRINADLVITVDNGIVAVEAADVCKQMGIDLIITDHHTPAALLPDAYAIVNPKLPQCTYPFKEICGTQIAWLFLGLVKQELGINIDMKQYLDLVAIATIADVMPLVHINRAIVQSGLKYLTTSQRPAMEALREFLGKSSFSSEDIAFHIAPRINSAGRMQDGGLALDFLTAKTKKEALCLLEELDTLNNERKSIESEAFHMAQLHVDSTSSIIVAAHEDWHEGVVGIVASRLASRYKKPAIVLSIEGEQAKGSARSVGSVNIFSLIKSQETLLTKFGGHMMAAGLSLPTQKIATFAQAINKAAAKLEPKDFFSNEGVVGRLASSTLQDPRLLEVLKKFEPYGEGNLRPKFLLKNAEIVSIKYFGAEKSHSKLYIRVQPHERQSMEFLLFSRTIEMPSNKKITCSYTVHVNSFRQQESLQLIIDEILL